MRRLAIATGGGVMVLVGILIGSRGDGAAALQSNDAALAERIERLEQSQSRDAARGAVRSGATTVVVQEGAAPKGAMLEPPPLDAEEIETRDREADREHFAGLAKAVEAESIDARFAAEKSQTLTASFAAAKLGEIGRVAKIDCRTQRCAIDIEYVRESVAADPRSSHRVIEWVRDQGCGFSVEGHAAADSRTRRVFLDCEVR
jgi:hypothetical protein